MTEAEIAALERKYEKWSGKANLLLMPGLFLALTTLPIVTVYQNSLPLPVLFTPVAILFAIHFITKKARRWEKAAVDRIAAHYSEKYMRTKWKTVADAEGVVVGVSTFGTNLILAFGNGVIETYERGMLTRID